MRRSTRARSVALIWPHGPDSASRAALTARSTSSAPPSGTVAHGSPVNGLSVS